MALPETVTILPQTFQQFNPFFVVVLTPVSLAIFGYLANKKKEPSAPRKIGLGMMIAACGFLILAIGSMGLPTPDALAADSKLQVLVSPKLVDLDLSKTLGSDGVSAHNFAII